ncbi:MAG: hypothetical protein GY838_00325 [bacterium]|nr:hypothetical protein [bacterium]
MLSSEFRKLIRPLAITLNIIWGAFLVAPIIYVGIAWFMFGMNDGAATDPPVSDFDPMLIQTILTVVAVVLVAASFIYRRWALSDEKVQDRMRSMAAPDATVGGFSAQQLAALKDGMESLSPAEQRLATVFPHYQQTTIITLAMREAISIFGLVLTILKGDFATVVPFAVVSVALMAGQPPRVATFMERVLRVARSF